MRFAGHILWLFVLVLCVESAQSADFSTPHEASINPYGYSANMAGVLGLNTVPNARMDDPGVLRGGVTLSDPYLHSFLGVQLAESLYVSLRQTAEVSGLTKNADRLYPGLDFKLRLIQENRSRPAVVMGAQSAVGHKRMAGEYIALSKRYKDFDFTAGLGWGRFAGKGHLDNPLKGLSSHFGKRRSVDGEMPNGPEDWFTGEDIGLFAGLEYFTPVRGLSVKLDWGVDRYSAEKQSFNFDAPVPWSLGVSYQTPPWKDIDANISLAAQGMDRIMARFTLKSNLMHHKDRLADADHTQNFRPFRTDLALPNRMNMSALRDGQLLYHTKTVDTHTAQTHLVSAPDVPLPYQLGRAAIHMSNHAGPAVESLTIMPTNMGLRGPNIHLLRRDFERALAHHQGSTQEVWQNAAFEYPQTGFFKKLKRPAEIHSAPDNFHLTLDNHLSLSEEDSGVLYRTGVLASYRGPHLFGFVDQGYALRLNIRDNLEKLPVLRPVQNGSGRSNVHEFADQALALDQSWLAFTHTLKPDLHMAVTGGYLEEMYAGLGGEILYRPFRSRWAVGAELWDVAKRDPDTRFNLGITSRHGITGHLNAWYDLPWQDVTLYGKFGRYLAGDTGASIGLEKQFKNGLSLSGYVTISNQADTDLFGGTTHADHGLRLSVPLGGYKYVPENISAKIRTSPLGRAIGQTIEKPLSLYAETEIFSYPHMVQHWDRILSE